VSGDSATLAAVILAAGRGERVGGRAKAAMTLPPPDGRSFVAAVVDTARAAGAQRIVVVAAAPWEAETRTAALAAGVPAADVVVNEAPERGMASSFACGLGALGAHDAVLAWPVDHPVVRADTVRALAGAARAGSIVVPSFGGRGGHPTLFDASLHDECLAAASAPDGLRSLLRAHPERVLRLVCDDPGVVRDVDTLDDWARLGQNRP
jgi:CTP:molybdopterin cytidylyltransferase MocA